MKIGGILMKFCRNCGKELAEGIKFCKHCGQDTAKTKDTKEVSKEEKSAHTNHEQQESPQPQQVKKEPVKLSKKSKLIMSVVGALIVLLFIGYKVGESITSYEKIVDNFEEAMIDKDAKKVAKMLVADTKNMKVDKDTVTGFIEYYNDNPSEMNSLFSHLKEQGMAYKHNPDYDDADLYYTVNLVKDGKTFVFDKYQIKVSPVYFNVSTNYKDSEITLNGDVIGTADRDEYSKEFGPYLPGTYTFGSTYKSDFVELEIEEDHSNIDSDYTKEVNLYIEGEEVYFEIPNKSGFESLKLYINDEDTGINLLEEDTIGPVLTDGSMEVAYEAEFPWGKVKTDNVPMDDYYMDVKFSADDELKKTIQETIVTYNQEYLQAITTADAKKFTVAGKTLIEDIIEDTDYRKKQDNFYKGKFMGVDFDNESFTLAYSDYNDDWQISVDLITIFEEDKYYSPYREAELEKAEHVEEYVLSYDEETEQWLVFAIGYGYVEGNDMIEHREKDPKTYTSEWEHFD